jgi:AcrR family transcriptional regulator
MTNKTVNKEASRTAEDWEEAALEAFASGGVRAASIPSIARSLGVTKGSFYWHFRSLDELVEAALRRWEERDRALLEKLGAVADPRRRLLGVFDESMHAPQAQALFVALGGSSIPMVTASIRRMSDRRIRFLTAAYTELGFAEEEARNRALLVYAAYAGLLHLRNESSPWLRSAKNVDAFIKHAVETLVPGTPARRR